jgi:hypothetical protein
MTEHLISIDEQAAPDAAYRAFCETCSWADPDGWHHSDAQPGWNRKDPLSDDLAGEQAWALATAAGAAHRAEQADPAPDIALFQALRVPGTDANGYAAYVESDSDKPGWADRHLDPGYSAAAR